MGIGGSRRPTANTPIPQYSPPYNISRPGSPLMSNMGGTPPLNSRQQQKLNDAYQTIQNYQNQMSMMQRGGPPIMNPQQMPYNSMNPNTYPPPSPLLQRLSGQSPYSYQQQVPITPGGYRDTDYAAVANIAGLNPTDVALLHREYMNLTRGGYNKLDRVVFRQLLREAMIEANNENIDRAIENIFVSIDRNHDGFIDFPEFIGAFRDILKGPLSDPQNYLSQQAIPTLINEQIRSNSQPVTYLQQSLPQVISIPSSNVQQSPLVYNGATPLVISLDANQSPYVVNSQGQSGGLQCVPLPI
jgi:hypothetical protein